MKKIILMHAVMGMCAALIIPNASCQTTVGFARVAMRTPEITEQKDEVVVPINTGKEYINTVSIKAVRAFIQKFKDAENVIWYKVEDGYVTRFVKDSIQNTVGYNKDGSWNYILKHYSEKQMSRDLRALVKSTYFDYTIEEVVEVKLPDEENIIYTMLIKAENNYKILKICNGEIEVISVYTTD